MKNLIEQASKWLQSESRRSGNIIQRTNAIVSEFRSYVLDEQQEISSNTGLSVSLSLSKIDDTAKSIHISDSISLFKREAARYLAKDQPNDEVNEIGQNGRWCSYV